MLPLIDMKTSQQIGTEIGARMTRLRLSRNVTQAMLAKNAGISTRTLRRFESGEPTTLDTFLRVALALDLGDSILGALPTGQTRPIERTSRSGSERRRARPKPQQEHDPTWTWGDQHA